MEEDASEANEVDVVMPIFTELVRTLVGVDSRTDDGTTFTQVGGEDDNPAFELAVFPAGRLNKEYHNRSLLKSTTKTIYESRH